MTTDSGGAGDVGSLFAQSQDGTSDPTAPCLPEDHEDVAVFQSPISRSRVDRLVASQAAAMNFHSHHLNDMP